MVAVVGEPAPAVSVVVSAGSVIVDGSVLVADGSVLVADGSVLVADGSVLVAEGSVLVADGSVLVAAGSVSVLLPSATVPPPPPPPEFAMESAAESIPPPGKMVGVVVDWLVIVWDPYSRAVAEPPPAAWTDDTIDGALEANDSPERSTVFVGRYAGIPDDEPLTVTLLKTPIAWACRSFNGISITLITLEARQHAPRCQRLLHCI